MTSSLISYVSYLYRYALKLELEFLSIMITSLNFLFSTKIIIISYYYDTYILNLKAMY